MEGSSIKVTVSLTMGGCVYGFIMGPFIHYEMSALDINLADDWQGRNTSQYHVVVISVCGAEKSHMACALVPP